MSLRESPSRLRRAAGSALLAVLWAVAILSIVVIGLTHSTVLELRVAKHQGDGERAYWLAVAGVEKAKAMIWHRTRGRGVGGDRNDAALYDDPAEFRDIELGHGLFRVVRQAESDEPRFGTVYGICDEERRLNVNTAALQEIARLPDADEALAASIVDWRDEDDETSPQGAERDHYLAGAPPMVPRNGPFETLRELLRVRGMDPRRLLGEDADGDALLDRSEDDGERQWPPDDEDGRLARGLSAHLTVDSGSPEINRLGEERIDLNLATEARLSLLPGISPEIAAAIVAHGGRKRFESLADLLDVRAPGAPQPGGEGERGSGRERAVVVDSGFEVELSSSGAPSGGVTPEGEERRGGDGRGEPQGPPLIDETLLRAFADDVTVVADPVLIGAVNVNTASLAVLASLEGLGPDLARAIADTRSSLGGFRSLADLFEVEGMTRDVFRKVAGRLTTRGGTFRVIAEGEVPSSGARRRVQAVVRIGDWDVETSSWQEEP